jgi:hypothetical protein
VATGVVGGISVIDIDPNGESWFHAHRDQLPQTRTHKTRREGWHLIYRYRPGLRCSNGRIAKGIDIKSDGGYVIWWPSAAGRVLCDGPVAEFPAWIAAGGMGTTSKSENGSANSSAVVPIPPFFDHPPTAHEINWAKKALGNAFLELRACRPGGRNAKLNALAYSMGRLVARGWITPERVEAMLMKGAEQCGLVADDGEKQCRATIASGIRAGISVPYYDIGSRVA